MAHFMSGNILDIHNIFSIIGIAPGPFIVKDHVEFNDLATPRVPPD